MPTTPPHVAGTPTASPTTSPATRPTGQGLALGSRLAGARLGRPDRHRHGHRPRDGPTYVGLYAWNGSRASFRVNARTYSVHLGVHFGPDLTFAAVVPGTPRCARVSGPKGSFTLCPGQFVTRALTVLRPARGRPWEDRRMLRWLTAGESHGPALVGVLEGLPADVGITTDDVRLALARRRLGYGRGARMKFEQDDVTFLGGVRHGRTQGGPVAIQVANTEWPKWETVMAADPVPPEVLSEQARAAALTRPRPGHADLVGMQKYGFDDARPVLERASARETAARVALGTVAAAFLAQAAGIRLVSHTVAIGPVGVPDGAPLPLPDDVAALDADPVRCHDPARERPDGRGDRRVPARGGHPRRRRRGGRLRPAAGSRQPRALGPAAGRPARRGPHGHPGHQGRRGRRRVPDGGPPRLGRARRDRARPGRRAAAAQRAGGRHRGRDVDRAASCGCVPR